MGNRIVLVTGSSRGIGKAVALELAAQGERVVVHCKERVEDGRRVVAEIHAMGKEAMLVQGDIAKEGEVARCFAEIQAGWGPVDVLINNAGISSIALFSQITPAVWREMIDVNLTGAYHCCWEAVPPMIEKKGGIIVNVSSMWGLVGASCEVHYSAAKAGLIGLTKALAKELAPSGIRVNCVAPGVVQTDMLSELDEATLAAIREETPLGYIATAEEVAKSIVFLCGDGGRFYTGQVLGPNGGYVIT